MTDPFLKTLLNPNNNKSLQENRSWTNHSKSRPATQSRKAMAALTHAPAPGRLNSHPKGSGGPPSCCRVVESRAKGTKTGRSLWSLLSSGTRSLAGRWTGGGGWRVATGVAASLHWPAVSTAVSQWLKTFQPWRNHVRTAVTSPVPRQEGVPGSPGLLGEFCGEQAVGACHSA